MDIERLALIAHKNCGIDKEKANPQWGKNVFLGVIFKDLTLEKAKKLVREIVEIEPMAVETLEIEKPNVIHTGEECVTVVYGERE